MSIIFTFTKRMTPSERALCSKILDVSSQPMNHLERKTRQTNHLSIKWIHQWFPLTLVSPNLIHSVPKYLSAVNCKIVRLPFFGFFFFIKNFSGETIECWGTVYMQGCSVYFSIAVIWKCWFQYFIKHIWLSQY